MARLLAARNQVDAEISRLLDRPAHPGHIGEWIAARVFDIELEAAANAPAVDGRFASGPLAGRTVNVKFYSVDDGLLDMTRSPLLDHYLVLRGPRVPGASSRRAFRPVRVTTVYLLDAHQLLAAVDERGVNVGIATSVQRALWSAAEVYPRSTSPVLAITEQQRRLLDLFPH